MNQPGTHKRLRSIVRAGGGGKFRGVVGVPSLNNAPAYFTVYFDSKRTGSTCTMRVAGLTPTKVRIHLLQSNEKFGITDGKV